MPKRPPPKVNRQPVLAELELAILRTLHAWHYEGRVGYAAKDTLQELAIDKKHGSGTMDRLRTTRLDDVPDYLVRAELRDLGALSKEFDAAFKRLVDTGKIEFTRWNDIYGAWRLPSCDILAVEGFEETEAHALLIGRRPSKKLPAHVRVKVNGEIVEQRSLYYEHECGKCYRLTAKGIEEVEAIKRRSLSAIQHTFDAVGDVRKDSATDLESVDQLKRMHAKTKNAGGRPPVSKLEARKRRQLVERWKQAKAAGVRQQDFCDDEAVALKHLTKCINWCVQRRRRSGDS